jgi:arylsulfatase A-like enzyme
VAGLESLPANYTITAVLGQISLKALDGLMDSYESTQTPFSLQFHFGAPHPPKVALPEFAQYYLDRMSTLRVPPSIGDEMKNSAYANANERKRMGGILDYPFNDPDRIAELHAIYYGMVEELDQWIGKILDRLESRPGTAKNTMIVFTSDHGDLMGAHGMVGKGVLLVSTGCEYESPERVWS